MTTTHADAFMADRAARRPGAGYYTGQELAGLKVAQIDDEIADALAAVKALRAERRAAVKALAEWGEGGVAGDTPQQRRNR
jgi:hypothetical protein